MVHIGDKLPNIKLKYLEDQDVKEVKTQDLFSGKKIVLIGVPGAFTPTCHDIHLGSFVPAIQDFFDKGIDKIIVTAVNDIFVLKSWGAALGVVGDVSFLADGNADFASALDLILDARAFGMGIRSQRYNMYVVDGVVRLMQVESNSGNCEITKAQHLLSKIPQEIS